MVRSEFLYLSDADMLASGVDDAARCVAVTDEVFRLLHEGDYLMGGPQHSSHGMGLPLPSSSPFAGMPTAGPDRRFVTMPAYVGGRFDVCGNKWYGSNPNNPAIGLPRSVLTLTLNDKTTGEPLAFMSANRLSAARTGAVPAAATRHLVRNAATSLAVVGCGVINRSVVTALLTQQPSIDTVVCHNRSRGKAEEFAAWLIHDYGLDVRVADNAVDCVRDADIVTVAASRTAPLHVPAQAFTKNAVILLSGPMQSDDELWTQSHIVYDHLPLHDAYVQDARSTGDADAAYKALIGGPLYRLIDAGAIPALADSRDLGGVMAAGPGAVGDGRVVFIACGMAVFDVAWGFEVLGSARRAGVGQSFDLWRSSVRPFRDVARAG